MEGLVKPPKHKRRKRDAAARLNRRVRQQFPDKKVTVDETYDGVKMSEVLKEFVAPFRYLAETKEAFLKLLATAVTAWNIALFPAKGRDVNGAFTN